MIPWPIALLILFYGGVAFYSAASLWSRFLGSGGQSPVVLVLWMALSAVAATGLIWLKPWGRRFAMITSWLFIVTTLSLSALFIASGKPAVGLATTFTTACHYLMIRYLKRPEVLGWFGEVPKKKAVQTQPEGAR